MGDRMKTKHKRHANGQASERAGSYQLGKQPERVEIFDDVGLLVCDKYHVHFFHRLVHIPNLQADDIDMDANGQDKHERKQAKRQARV